MAAVNPNITLGTAGHVDHGKTALVKFFTGCDTDRLKIEKERGMSIDLGFAPSTIGGVQVGIVDVPGHESFVKTMVAGASGMDGCILVVAADDGVMPQTREHLDILSLLGVEHGVVALTKSDCVNAEELELAREQVREFLRGSFLEGAPICPVCNLTGDGFEALYEALEQLVRAITPKPTHGVFRLPVERAFSVKGFGTVVAGVPVSGRLTVGQEVILLPQGETGRVKRIEVYGQPTDAALAGQCAAVNVARWDSRTIGRGDAAAEPGFFEPGEWHACRLRLLPCEQIPVRTGERLMFHTNTSEAVAAVYLMEGDRLRGGEEGLAQVHTTRPLIAAPGDRFIVRSPAQVRTVGGGIIVERIARRLKRHRPGVCEDLAARARAVGNAKDFIEYCVKDAGAAGTREEDVAVRVKLPLTRARELLATGAIHEPSPGLYVHSRAANEQAVRLLDAVRAFHKASPARAGIRPDELLKQAGIGEDVGASVIKTLVEEDRLTETDGRLALPGHSVQLPPEDRELLDATERTLREGGFHPPALAAVAEATGASEERAEWALALLTERGAVVEVAPGLFFHAEAVAHARQLLESHIRREGRLESVKFKYLLDTTRKFAIPLLDYFDRIGVTKRDGYTRHLGKG